MLQFLDISPPDKKLRHCILRPEVLPLVNVDKNIRDKKEHMSIVRKLNLSETINPWSFHVLLGPHGNGNKSAFHGTKYVLQKCNLHRE